ncbi:ADP-ribosylglycohydrolase family protein [Haloferula sp.]|uniref:ADP-ribosylglycohydrolase family protein n=1 Tax=Haloferula sp. TaxID=2497595 RepID=UPI003C70B769
MKLNRERFRGALLGLACGDALGTTVEFKPRGTFTPLNGIVGGGPFRLEAGQWTDDTSMALCLAESLISCEGVDLLDQCERYVAWWLRGVNSPTGSCFDIGNTVRAALEQFELTSDPESGSTHPRSAGNGSIMRLAPIAMFFANRPSEISDAAAASSRTTHGAKEAVDACRYYAALIAGALHGVSKDDLLAPGFSESFCGLDGSALAPAIAGIEAGEFKGKSRDEVRGSGYVVQSLEAALWAFWNSESFEEGALLAVNLGEDADTTGAVFGQIAGAFYGEEGIPQNWRGILAWHDQIQRIADQLHALAKVVP